MSINLISGLEKYFTKRWKKEKKKNLSKKSMFVTY